MVSIFGLSFNNLDFVEQTIDLNNNTIIVLTTGADSMGGDLNMLNNKILNLPEPTAAHEAATKNYNDSKFPTVTAATNGSFLQVRSGKWDVSAVNGIPITNLNNITVFKSGCVYTFNNATVSSPIPNGGSGQFVMLVLSTGSFAGGVDNALFVAGSIT